MNPSDHYEKLENMFNSAPINQLFNPRIKVDEGRAVIDMEVTPQLFHAGGAMHGAVYFKLMDDAAYFAAISLEYEVFLLTSTFTTYFTRPVSEGTLKVVGTMVNRSRTQFIAEAVVYDQEEREISRGSGIFVRSKVPLNGDVGYRL